MRRSAFTGAAAGFLASCFFVWSAAAEGFSTAADNAKLSGLSTADFNSVLRLGVAAPGDAPPVLFVKSTAACTEADIGSQVASADAKCWKAIYGAEGADFRQWGAQPGANVDKVLKAAIAWACSSHLPVLVPYSAAPYQLNSEIDIGDGSATSNSTCNGVTIKVTQQYPEATPSTRPPNHVTFKYNGSATATIPLVVKGPAASINLLGVGIDCNSICATGIKIDNALNSEFGWLSVSGNAGGPAFVITSEPVNAWAGGLEGSRFHDIWATAPAAGGSGMQVGVIDCGKPCYGDGSCSVIADQFDNLTLNYDPTTPGTYGINFGFANQLTLTHVRITPHNSNIIGDAIKVSPVSGPGGGAGRTSNFPANIAFYHPIIQGRVVDPGPRWRPAAGIHFDGWSTVYSAFPAPGANAAFWGTDTSGRHYPRRSPRD